jgi:hypothetical protein
MLSWLRLRLRLAFIPPHQAFPHGWGLLLLELR